MGEVVKKYTGYQYYGDDIPDMPNGMECREIIVCVKRAHNGKMASFSAYYLNDMFLYPNDVADDGDNYTGWFYNDGGEDEPYYLPLLLQGDELVAWSYVPKFEDS